MITKVTTNSHDEWLALRGKYIGGSDAAAVVGLNPYTSAFSLWAEKTGRLPGFEGNLATEVGTYLEEFVAQKFSQETGKKVRRVNQSILNDEYPWAIANIDRDIVGEDAGLEIKTTSELNLKKFKGGEYPTQYYAQMTHYLAVTGKKRWYLAVLIGNREFRVYILERDEDEIKALMEAEKAFWQHVVTDTPPATDGSDSTGKTLNQLHPNSDGSVVDVAGFELEIDRYYALWDQADAIEEQMDAIVNKLKAYLGNAERGESKKYKVSWKGQTRSSFDHKRFAADHPEMELSHYYKTSGYRTFKITEPKQK